MRELNPVLIKELRNRMRGARAFILITIYLLVLSGITMLIYLAVASNLENDMNAGRQIGKILFLSISTVALIEVCLITPALTAGSIVGEKERQSYDLLISSLLTPGQIVRGKLGSALAFAVILIIAVLPVMSLSFLFGGVILAEVVIALIGLLTTAILYASIGLFWSTVMRSSLGATIISLSTIVAILLLIPFLWVISSVFYYQVNRPSELEASLYVYVGGTVLCFHPFIALGLTEAFLSDGDSPFYSVIRISRVELIVPSPWIVYVGLALLVSALLMFLAVRFLRPEYEGRVVVPKRKTNEENAPPSG
jgi:ABC-2 type transport system permease protein